MWILSRASLHGHSTRVMVIKWYISMHQRLLLLHQPMAWFVESPMIHSTGTDELNDSISSDPHGLARIECASTMRMKPKFLLTAWYHRLNRHTASVTAYTPYPQFVSGSLWYHACRKAYACARPTGSIALESHFYNLSANVIRTRNSLFKKR